LKGRVLHRHERGLSSVCLIFRCSGTLQVLQWTLIHIHRSKCFVLKCYALFCSVTRDHLLTEHVLGTLHTAVPIPTSICWHEVCAHPDRSSVARDHLSQNICSGHNDAVSIPRRHAGLTCAPGGCRRCAVTRDHCHRTRAQGCTTAVLPRRTGKVTVQRRPHFIR
jgi:hypothetical protein